MKNKKIKKEKTSKKHQKETKKKTQNGKHEKSEKWLLKKKQREEAKVHPETAQTFYLLDKKTRNRNEIEASPKRHILSNWIKKKKEKKEKKQHLNPEPSRSHSARQAS